MRVLIAPDKFAGTLTAVEAADAIAAGWRKQRPDDELDLAPMADGGPGFVDVLHAALGGELLAATVAGPFGRPVPATLLLAGGTAYVESAQACGLHLTGREGAESATTVGVGRAGRGRPRLRRRPRSWSGSAAAAPTTAVPAFWPRSARACETPLDAGAAGLDGISAVDLGPARARVAGVRLVAATDVDNPLTGLFGATKTFGPQKGIPEERLPVVDGWLEQLAVATDRRTALEKGAGAAGGLGLRAAAAGRRA